MYMGLIYGESFCQKKSRFRTSASYELLWMSQNICAWSWVFVHERYGRKEGPIFRSDLSKFYTKLYWFQPSGLAPTIEESNTFSRLWILLINPVCYLNNNWGLVLRHIIICANRAVTLNPITTKATLCKQGIVYLFNLFGSHLRRIKCDKKCIYFLSFHLLIALTRVQK